ncbi:MAG: NfeD family protein [Treponemataceae bacterium]
MLNFVLFLTPYFWLVLFVVLIIIEATTYNLTTIWFALSCIPLIFLSYFDLPWVYQILIFVILSAVLLAFTRPFVLKKLKQKKNPNQLEGKKIIITKAILPNDCGEGKTKNGVTWTVIAEDNTEIEMNTVCKIIKVEGNTLTVKALG